VSRRSRTLIERTGSAFANRAGEAGAYDFSLKGNRAFQVWTQQWAVEAFRVLKPGGHLLAFAGTRTYHRMAAGIEDAGFEIRDCLAWMYGSGFPKSLDVSKAIDKGAGHWRGRAGAVASENGSMSAPNYERTDKGDPVTAAAAWDGWGTALKPAFEPIVLARKPLIGTIAANVLHHGTGALNVDGCRIEGGSEYDVMPGGDPCTTNVAFGSGLGVSNGAHDLGRWPANVLLDEDAAAALDEQTGELASGANPTRRGSDKFRGVFADFAGQEECEPARGADSGGASRFFYVAKASRAERNAGLDAVVCGTTDDGRHTSIDNPFLRGETERKNIHPTVKPIALMRHLVRLVTPPGGTVLDPFLGSGTTGIAASLEGLSFIGCERENDYMRIAEARIAFWTTRGERALSQVADLERARKDRERRTDAGQLDLFAAMPGGTLDPRRHKRAHLHQRPHDRPRRLEHPSVPSRRSRPTRSRTRRRLARRDRQSSRPRREHRTVGSVHPRRPPRDHRRRRGRAPPRLAQLPRRRPRSAGRVRAEAADPPDREVDGDAVTDTMLCAGPSHTAPTLVPIDRFPRRADRPCGRHSRCADCTNWEKVHEHHGEGGHGLELASRYHWIFRELRARLGISETARRLGRTRQATRDILNGRTRRVRRITLRRAVEALREARARDEVYSKASIHYGLRRPGYQPTRPRDRRDYVDTRSDSAAEAQRRLRAGATR
jgi:DNA modification methylase